MSFTAVLIKFQADWRVFTFLDWIIQNMLLFKTQPNFRAEGPTLIYVPGCAYTEMLVLVPTVGVPSSGLRFVHVIVASAAEQQHRDHVDLSRARYTL